ncbi:hypothetical protein PYCC9005_002314 [Savitreella phatthalungensis]
MSSTPGAPAKATHQISEELAHGNVHGHDGPRQHVGRGGAGNYERYDPDYHEDQTGPPELRGPYSTGRGGGGNIVANDAGREAALVAQGYNDRENEGSRDMLKPNRYAGRGGSGNIEAARKSHDLQNRPNVERLKAEAEAEGTHEHKQHHHDHHHTGLGDKIKHIFK